nr:hypothetical protein [Rhizobium ruizarguesonis]
MFWGVKSKAVGIDGQSLPNGTQVDVSGVGFASRNDRLWGGVGLGGSFNLADDKYSIYGEVSANTSLQSFGDSYSINGTVGLRVKW